MTKRDMLELVIGRLVELQAKVDALQVNQALLFSMLKDYMSPSDIKLVVERLERHHERLKYIVDEIG
jgi:hypothetical protein